MTNNLLIIAIDEARKADIIYKRENKLFSGLSSEYRNMVEKMTDQPKKRKMTSRSGIMVS